MVGFVVLREGFRVGWVDVVGKSKSGIAGIWREVH